MSFLRVDSAKKKKQYLVSHQKRSHGSWRKCKVRHAFCAYSNVFTVFLCQSHGSVRIVEQLSNPLNYVKPAVHLVIKFHKNSWKKKNVPHTTASDFPIPLPGNQLPLGNTSGCQCNKRDGLYHLFEESQKKKKHVTENDAEPPQSGFLHTDCYTRWIYCLQPATLC